MKTVMQWTVEDYHKLTNLGMFCDHPVELLEGQIVEMGQFIEPVKLFPMRLLILQ
ncbi:MAG: hypothetical protein ACKO2V_09780 [Snowella sp.]